MRWIVEQLHIELRPVRGQATRRRGSIGRSVKFTTPLLILFAARAIGGDGDGPALPPPSEMPITSQPVTSRPAVPATRPPVNSPGARAVLAVPGMTSPASRTSPP